MEVQLSKEDKAFLAKYICTSKVYNYRWGDWGCLKLEPFIDLHENYCTTLNFRVSITKMRKDSTGYYDIGEIECGPEEIEINVRWRGLRVLKATIAAVEEFQKNADWNRINEILRFAIPEYRWWED